MRVTSFAVSNVRPKDKEYPVRDTAKETRLRTSLMVVVGTAIAGHEVIALVGAADE